MLVVKKNDVSQAVAKNDQFDFLIDIVPRDEIKPAKRVCGSWHNDDACYSYVQFLNEPFSFPQEDNIQRASLQNEPVQYFFQVGQQPAQQQPATVQLQSTYMYMYWL